MKKVLTYGLLAAGLAVIGYLIYFNMTAVEDGDYAPDFEATTTAGKKFKLSDHKGDYVLLDFWASWCGPCRVEFPEMIKLYEDVGDKLTIVSIALEKDGQAGIDAAKRHGFPWKYQIVEESNFVMTGDISSLYGVSSIPTKILIGPKGQISLNPSYDLIRDKVNSL